VRSILFEVSGRPFKLESDGNVRRVIDRNNVEWSDVQLSDAFGETEATTALAYALRDLERFTQYRVPDER
jgi:hypothetical protein